jgi:hypothetical protein
MLFREPLLVSVFGKQSRTAQVCCGEIVKEEQKQKNDNNKDNSREQQLKEQIEEKY